MKMRPLRKLSRVLAVVFLCSVLFVFFPASISAAVVTLDSIEIFTTHEWLNLKPTVYFRCKGENRTVLPDVKKKNVKYTFKGEESWQPLTNITDKKCKRCGFYEHDVLKSDDMFSEWEFCASDFSSSNGKYTRFEEKEFRATFLCPECASVADGSTHSSSSHKSKDRMHQLFAVLITVSVLLVLVVGAAIAYKYWQKRKRQQEQARFLKLFEDNDDIEDELGIGPLSHVI